jgi:hypothetical protein
MVCPLPWLAEAAEVAALDVLIEFFNVMPRA